MQFPYKNKIDKLLSKFVDFTGADDRICAFSGAPRSAIINCRLCRQVYHCPTALRQSVLLPQNGSSRAKCGLLCTRSPQTPTHAFAHLAPKKYY